MFVELSQQGGPGAWPDDLQYSVPRAVKVHVEVDQLVAGDAPMRAWVRL